MKYFIQTIWKDVVEIKDYEYLYEVNNLNNFVCVWKVTCKK